MTSATVFSHFDGLTCTACVMCVLAPDARVKAGGATTCCPVLTPSLAASPAPTLVSQAKAQVFALARALVFGSSSRVLLANFDPTLCCWKTSQLSLPGMEMSLLPRLPRWGMTLAGALYERPTPEPPTSENDGSVWPTPRTGITRQQRGTAQIIGNRMVRKSGQDFSLDLVTIVNMENWATPRAEERMQYNSQDDYKALSLQVKDWPTPQTRDFRTGSAPDSPRMERKAEQGWSANLNDVVNWPTPAARDWRDGRASQDTMERNSRPLNETVMSAERQEQIEWALGISEKKEQPANWGTPRVSMCKGSGPSSAAAMKIEGRVAEHNGASQLNPDWVETLMGFPPGWTDPMKAYTSRDLGSLNTTGSQPESPTVATSEPAA